MYTDGACSGNPGPGGWAWAIEGGASDSGSDADTTNQRMELTAVLKALDANPGPLEIVSDSTYVVNCFNDRWYDGWLRRNWRNSNRKPVANRDLWEPVVDHFQRRRDELVFTWVKGHSGDKMNDVVDAMAVAEVDSLRQADAVAVDQRIEQIEVPWSVEKAVLVLGGRNLGRNEDQWLARTIGGLDPSSDVVVSGLRRGTELRGAELALAHKVPLAVVLPFAEPDRSWPSELRRRFAAAMKMSSWLVDLELPPTDVAGALRNRNRYLACAAAGAVVVGDDSLAKDLDGNGLTVIQPPADLDEGGGNVR